MAEQGERIQISTPAGADLSDKQYRVVDIDGTLATETDEAFGVLQNKPESGEHATLAVLGKMKGVAGEALSAKARLTVASGGFLIAVSSGSGCCGKNLNVSVGSGDVFTFVGNFINAATNHDQQ